jgi:hypothetical protein
LRRSGSVDVAVCKAWMQRPRTKRKVGRPQNNFQSTTTPHRADGRIS